MADAVSRPLIWVLKGLRAGDTAQAMELALQVGGRVEGKQLAFNRLHVVPNWLAGARVSHLSPGARSLLRPPWPDLVVATGKRTAPVSLWIKQQSGGRTRCVQLGRPRMAVDLFDLVVSTPQYGLPPGSNVMQIPAPFSRPKTVPPAELLSFQTLWADLPRPWIVGVMGGPNFPQRLAALDIKNFGKALDAMASRSRGSVILIDSPRSPSDAVELAKRDIAAPVWSYRRGTDGNPYQSALALGDAFMVTSDSVSMVTEMILTGKPTTVFRLPVSGLVPRWSAQSGIGAIMARSGILHPPRNVDGLMTHLKIDGHVSGSATVAVGYNTGAIAKSHDAVVERIRFLLASSSVF
jgi:uncharacterized protein